MNTPGSRSSASLVAVTRADQRRLGFRRVCVAMRLDVCITYAIMKLSESAPFVAVVVAILLTALALVIATVSLIVRMH